VPQPPRGGDLVAESAMSSVYGPTCRRVDAHAVRGWRSSERRYGTSVAGYSGAALPRKLGIKPESRVLLDGAPDGFDLGELPAGATVHRRAGGDPYDVVLIFCPDAARLRTRWPALHGRTTPAGSLWVAWPKRAAGVPTDLDENRVRDHALANGRVDVKVCAIDDVWSGLKNVIRVADR
jgi:hypothetical protein